MQICDVVDFAILGSLLYLLLDMTLLAHVFVFDLEQIFIELHVNVFLFLFKILKLYRLVSS
jgi:hypothetical protein